MAPSRKVSGGDFEEATPDPIPNSEVKLFGADGTAREAVWESRTPPGFSLRLMLPLRDMSLFTFVFRFRHGEASSSGMAFELCGCGFGGRGVSLRGAHAVANSEE